MSWLKKLIRAVSPNPLDCLLQKACRKGYKKFLIPWNRGLGDIPLGLYALVWRIKSEIHNASITFLTRPDLEEGFLLLSGTQALVAQEWKRGQKYQLKRTLEKLHLLDYDCIFEHPDPTYWCQWQLGTLTPRLYWNKEWDEKHLSYSIPSSPLCIGVHVQTGTEACYGYEKNWPLEHWQLLFKKIDEQCSASIVLFGQKSSWMFEGDNVVDLRGKTTLIELISFIKNRCTHLIVPDSGILSCVYFLDVSFPLRLVSLWADPRQGVLKQGVNSPNPLLHHCSLTHPSGRMSDITVNRVMEALFYA